MRKALCLGVPLLLALTLLLSSAFGGERPGRGGRGGRVKRGSKGGTDTSPAVGAEAPDFDLVKVTAFLEKTKGGQVPEKWAEADKVKLSSFRNKKPVVFALSSYTWPPFRARAGSLERFYQAYKDKAAFFVIYIHEAHPARTEEQARQAREKGQKHLYAQPPTAEKRAEAADACLNGLGLSMPFLLDDMKDGAEKTYVGWPNRIYVIGLDGKVVMKGRRGPKGCEVTRAEKELNAYLGKIGVRAPPAIDWRKNSPETGGGTSAKGVPDGAYIGKADGLGGPLKVEVTVKGGKIASVKITEHMESDRRPDVKKALSAVPKSIVARQNARVDTVSKATATSNAVMKAVESALKSARK